MNHKQRIFVKQRRRKDRFVLPCILIAILVIVICLIITFLSEMGKDKKGSSSLPSSSDLPSMNSSSEGDQPSSEEEPSSEESASSQEPPSEVPWQEATFDKPVPLSPKMETSYFDNAVFIGDSLTDGFKIYSDLGNAQIFSFTGLNPDTIKSAEKVKLPGGNTTVMGALSQLPAPPGKIYIMMGTNGIGWLKQDRFMADYASFLDQLKTMFPNTPIYVQSILPVTAEKEATDGNMTNGKINQYNDLIAKMCTKKQVYYLNVAEAIKGPDGTLPPDESPDGIHFGKVHYGKWVEYLKTHVVGE